MICKFTSLTLAFEDVEFQSDLKEWGITAIYVSQSTSGFPEFEYTGERRSLERLIKTWFGNDDGLLDMLSQDVVEKSWPYLCE